MAKETKEKEILQYAVGRRKRAIARVRMYPGSGKILINEKPLESYVDSEAQRVEFLKPVVQSGMTDDHDFTVKVIGGGISGQLGAAQHGVARCIAKVNDDMKSAMRNGGFLTRDPREKERKKVYHVRARKMPQFSKR